MVDDSSIANIIIFSGTCACIQHQILTSVKSMIKDLQQVKNREISSSIYFLLKLWKM